MSYNVETIPKFDKQLKKLVKKYPSFKNDFISLVCSLKENPTQGTPLGNNCFKIRVAITAKAKVKSGGARVISHCVVTKTTLFLISIYDKSEQDTISDNEIKDLLKDIPE